MWGEGGHEVDKNGEKWILFPEIIFFNICKKIRKLKKNTTKMPKFGSNLAQFGPKWVIFEFSTKKRKHFSTPETRLGA